MLTVFSTPKPFHGHSGIIQRNALKSWTLLHPDVEVILFGDEDGAAETCLDLGIRHEPNVRRNENGTKHLNYIFDRAHEISRHKILCYANCDIMLASDFRAALELISKTYSEFLMIGRRWDTNITEPWDFGQADWDHQLRSLALLSGKQNGPKWVDYFCFSRDLYYGENAALLNRSERLGSLAYLVCTQEQGAIDRCEPDGCGGASKPRLRLLETGSRVHTRPRRGTLQLESWRR